MWARLEKWLRMGRRKGRWRGISTLERRPPTSLPRSSRPVRCNCCDSALTVFPSRHRRREGGCKTGL
uniref:Neural cell expressed, developmentally down-regulated 9 n=1 Tax=Molossus molossus TaxID=27622 RepID=A0A7J8FA40_MOLMO|nr:neural precursor cell expressed, developmentally down-regulated 9 [Molossus molossus]